jgi:hypothetical protein
MSGLKKSLLLLTATTVTSFATTFSFVENPANNIIGDPSLYEVFGAQLTTPTTPGGQWTLTIDMNYDVPIPGSCVPPTANNCAFFPAFPIGGVNYVVGDFIFQQTVPSPTGRGTVTNNYAIVLSNHLDGEDGSNYTPGDLYQASTVETSAQILTSLDDAGQINENGATPVWLGPGGTQNGTGSLSVVPNTNDANGTASEWTVTDTFTVSPTSSFLNLNDPFTIDFTTAICANGELTGEPVPPPPPSSVPEPGTMALMVPGLLLLGFAARKRIAN